MIIHLDAMRKRHSSKNQKPEYHSFHAYQLGWAALALVSLVYIVSVALDGHDTSQPAQLQGPKAIAHQGAQGTYGSLRTFHPNPVKGTPSSASGFRQQNSFTPTMASTRGGNGSYPSPQTDHTYKRYPEQPSERGSYAPVPAFVPQGQINPQRRYRTMPSVKTVRERKDDLLTSNVPYGHNQRQGSYPRESEAPVRAQLRYVPSAPKQHPGYAPRSSDFRMPSQKQFEGYVVGVPEQKPTYRRVPQRRQPQRQARLTQPTKTLFGIRIAKGRNLRKMKRYWAKLRKRHPRHFKRLKPRIVKPKNSKHTLHLIAGPFSNIARAVKVCAVLKSKLDCELTFYNGHSLSR